MADTFPHLFNVVLCNDTTDALWPLVRTDAPREFQTQPEHSTSLLARIVDQIRALSARPTILVCSIGQVDVYADHLEGQGIQVLGAGVASKTSDNSQTSPAATGTRAHCVEIIGLPLDRGSAFSVAAAAAHVKRLDPLGIIFYLRAGIVFDADEMWDAAVGRAYRAASEDNIALIGARPTLVSTHHGYIRPGAQLPGILNVYRISEYLENPPGAKAGRMQQIGAFFDTGLMFARASVVLGEMVQVSKLRRPDESEDAGRIVETASFLVALGHERWASPDAEKVISSLPRSSFACAVLQASERVAVVDSSITWNEFNDLRVIGEFMQPDDCENTCTGDTVVYDSNQMTVFAQDKLVATLGTSNLLVIDTPDCMFIADKNKLAKHSELVEAVRAKSRQVIDFSIEAWHAWGTSTLVDSAETYELRRLEILPGHTMPFDRDGQTRICAQVLSGRGTLQLVDESRRISSGSHFDVNLKSFRQVKALGTESLVILATHYFV